MVIRLIQTGVLVFLLGYLSDVQAGAGWSGQATVVGIYTLNENSAIIKLSNLGTPISAASIILAIYGLIQRHKKRGIQYFYRPILRERRSMFM